VIANLTLLTPPSWQLKRFYSTIKAQFSKYFPTRTIIVIIAATAFIPAKVMGYEMVNNFKQTTCVLIVFVFGRFSIALCFFTSVSVSKYNS
jgi:hypothetical protein